MILILIFNVTRGVHQRPWMNARTKLTETCYMTSKLTVTSNTMKMTSTARSHSNGVGLLWINIMKNNRTLWMLSKWILMFY